MPGADWPYKGARWWKFDFHTHTPHSADTHWARNNVQLSPDAWLKSFMDAGVDCVAITDHNGAGWIDRLKNSYQALEGNRPNWFRQLHLFPGVEISVNGGFHVLAIFDKDTESADVLALLGAVGHVGTRGGSDDETQRSAVDVIQAIADAGGLAIPAHADETKGLFKVTGLALRQVLESAYVLAAEVLNPAAPKPQQYIDLRCGWTEVLGTDTHGFTGRNEPGTRYTWVKMGSPCLEGLRLALLDGQGFSVRRSDEGTFDPLRLPSRFIESIEVESAYVMGNGTAERVHFNPAFTALVGGRGTGKSTIVHCLRYPLRRDGELEVLDESNHARQTFTNFNQVVTAPTNVGGLRTATNVIVNYSRDGIHYRLKWKRENEAVTVEEWADDAWRASENQLVSVERFPIRIMSQGQLVTLAKDTGALLKLIDESAELRADHEQMEAHTNRYLRLQAEVRELQEQLRNEPAARLAFQDASRRLTEFEAHGGAEAVTEFRRRERQRTHVQSRIDAARDLGAAIERLTTPQAQEAAPDDLFNPEDQADLAALGILDVLVHSRSDAEAALHGVAEQLITSANNAENPLRNGPWRAAFDQAQNRFQEATRQLAQQGTTQEGEVERLLERRRTAEEQLSAFSGIQRELEAKQADAATSLADLQQARRDLSWHRELFLAEHLANNPLVHIAIQKFGRDKEAIERSIRKTFNIEDGRFQDDIRSTDAQGQPVGLVNALLRNLPDVPENAANEIEARIARFKEQVALACKGEPTTGLGGHFKNYLRREFQQRPEFLDRVMTWFPDDSFHLQYSRTGDGRNFHEIVQASDGQRAATMLAFLLAFGTDPLVIDQPEDDLDNTLIYGLIVQQIREKKGNRQIIAVTHNANVVVNGDAELVNVLDFRAGQCRVVETGCLQERHVRDEVCRVLEGGREAFSKRYRRLGSP